MDRFVFAGKDVTDEQVKSAIYSINRFKVGDPVFIIYKKGVSKSPKRIQRIDVSLFKDVFIIRYFFNGTSKYYKSLDLWRVRKNAVVYSKLSDYYIFNTSGYRRFVYYDEKHLSVNFEEDYENSSI